MEREGEGWRKRDRGGRDEDSEGLGMGRGGEGWRK